MIILVSTMDVARGPRPLIEHLCSAENNEAVIWRRGGPQGIEQKYAQARKFGRLHACVQIVVNSYEDLPWPVFEERVLPCLVAEFPQLNFADADIVQHFRDRVDPLAAAGHYHICVRAFDEDSGRPIRLSHPYPRVEKVSRVIEHDLGFSFVKGPNLDSIIPRLRAEGRTDVADALRAAFPPTTKQVAHSFSPAVLQQAKRLVKQHYKVATKTDADGVAVSPASALKALRASLEPHGITIDVGPYDPPRWIVIKSEQVIGKLAGMTGEKIEVVENKLGSPANANREAERRGEAEPGGPGEPTPQWDDLEYARIVDAAHADGSHCAAPPEPDAGERDAAADFIAELQRRGETIAAIAQAAEDQAIEPIVRFNRQIVQVETEARRLIDQAKEYEHPESLSLEGNRRDLKKWKEKEEQASKRLQDRAKALKNLQGTRVPSIFRPIRRWKHKRAVAAAQAMVDVSTKALEKASQSRRDAKKRVDYWIEQHDAAAAEARKPMEDAARLAERELRICTRARELVKNDTLVLRYSAAGVIAMAQKDVDRWDHFEVERWERGSEENDTVPSLGP